MLDFICGIIILILSLAASNLEFIGDREVKIIIIFGWLIALFFAKGGY